MFNDHGSHDTCFVINFLTDGNAANHVAEFNSTGFLGNDRHIVGIPLHKRFALLDRATIRNGNHRSDHHGIAFELPAIFSVDSYRSVLGQHDVGSIQSLYCSQIVEA